MDKKLVGLLGAAAGLATLGSAQAATPTESPQTSAASYRELLDPIANPVAALKADDEAALQRSPIETAQYYPYPYGYYGDYGYYRHYHHHHHHHHHHHGVVFGPGGVFVR